MIRTPSKAIGAIVLLTIAVSSPFCLGQGTYTPLDPGRIYGTSEPIGPSSRRGGLIISEIMYNPTNRPDTRELEYIEIYNTNPWFENIGGYRLSGEIDYVFPANTTIPAQSYLLVAPVPADIQAVYGVTAMGGRGLRAIAWAVRHALPRRLQPILIVPLLLTNFSRIRMNPSSISSNCLITAPPA